MNKQQEPRLRFQGFMGTWEEKYLGKLAEQVKSYPLSRNVETSEKTGFKYIHYGDIHRGIADIIDSDENLPNIQAGNFELLKSGDLVVADVSEDYEGVGAACVIDGALKNKVVSGLHTIAIRPNQTISLFLYYLLKTQAFKQYGRLIGTGTKVVGITASKFLNFQTNIPTLPEQTHLGLFFRRLDSQIAESRAVLEKSRQLKKAMLAKMFPENGEKIPKIRFKGFEGEWREWKLGAFGKATSGTSLESEFCEDGNYKVISIGSYSEKSTYTDQGIRTHKNDKTEKRILNKNDLTMILNDKTSSGRIIGRVLLIDQNDTYVYNQRTQRIEIDQEHFIPLFLYHLLNAENMRQKIIYSAQGNTQIYVNWSGIKNLEYLIPPTKAEQTAIGNFFRQLDETIALQLAEVEKLNQLKKGLLAAMLI
jgi:restriction modification system DNA specificity domain protein